MLKQDPTRSITLRRAFESAMARRFKLLNKRIREMVVGEDAFGLVRNAGFDAQRLLVTNWETTQNSRWAYQTSLQKLYAFRTWLQEQMKSIITSADEWWEDYVRQGYEKGAKRALDDVFKTIPDPDAQMKDFGVTKRQFMTSAFGRVVPIEKVKVLASRVLSDLDGIEDWMETHLMRSLTDGLTQGQHPNVIAERMARTVGIGLGRARTLAQTEIIRAHAEGQLDSLERLGVTEVGVTVEWSTAGDNHVCPLCRPLEGVILTTQEARGIIPRHPRCRCSFKPAGLIAAKTQVRERRAIEAAITKSLGAEKKQTKSGMAKSGKLHTWVGSKIKVAAKRPQPLFS